MNTKSFKITLTSIFLIILIMAALLCGHEFILPENEALSKTGFFFDTIVTITAYTSDFYDKNDSFFKRNSIAEERCTSFLDSCFEDAYKYEHLLSKTIEGSDIYNINNAGGTSVPVSSDTAYLLKKSVYYAELSNGVFDPTIGTVSELWDFSADTDKSLPQENALKNAVSHVDYHCIVISEDENGNSSVMLKDPEAKIDLGGIAKGFIADKLKEKFLSENISSGIINLGGNVLLVGSKKVSSFQNNKSDDYIIGIQKPFGEANETSVSINVSDKSVVTSGIYDRYFTVDNTIYHHILDTKTGYPVKNDVLSATIISASSLDGDALSTICLSLGTKKGMELISSIPDIQVLYIKDNYEVVCTENFPLTK